MSNNAKKDAGKKEETTIQNIKTGQERAFYGSRNVHFKNIIIDGIEQGESAFKECRNISIEDTNIALKYCVWHCHNITLYKSIIDVNSRASIWYCENMEIINCKLNGIKVCRNCWNLTIKDSVINSDDFGWMCEGVKLINCKISGVTPLLHSSNVTLDGIEFNAKYILQYANNIKMYNTTIDTKDCFWHAKNVYCKNCKLVGEYLAWYSENCVFENCHIDSIQPLCYCKKLKLINCTMANCNLGFEYSDVEADIKGHVDSIRNVLSGKIICDSLGEYVQDEHVLDCKGVIEIRPKDEEKETEKDKK
jgi:hypothetical protein